jgi:cytochrome P450
MRGFCDSSQIGPVVRIQPNEVHLADQKNFEAIYHVGSKYTKSPVYYWAICIPNATHTTISNELHKRKRARLNPMFSRKMVLELEGVVQDKANKVVALTQDGINAKRPVDLHHAFRCVSVDVITEYAFDKSYNLLDTADLGAEFFRMVRGLGPAMWFFQNFPAIRDLVLKIPPSVQLYMGGALKQVTTLQQEGVKQLLDVKSRIEAGKLDNSRPTIFSELMDPEKQDGYPVPPPSALKDEVYSILAAAADTTGNAMTVAAYKVIGNAAIYKSVREELHRTFPDPNARLDFMTLEKLPYLVCNFSPFTRNMADRVQDGSDQRSSAVRPLDASGFSREMFANLVRLSFGVPGRLPRVVPEGGATFNGHYVAEGVSNFHLSHLPNQSTNTHISGRC